jgi:hypothetical protein
VGGWFFLPGLFFYFAKNEPGIEEFQEEFMFVVVVVFFLGGGGGGWLFFLGGGGEWV